MSSMSTDRLTRKVRQTRHDAGRAVAPLQENLGAAGTRRFGNRGPVGTIILEIAVARRDSTQRS